MRKVFPRQGLDKKILIRELEELKKKDADWYGGKTWSLVYYGGDEHHDFLKKAHQLYFAENALNPIAFQSLKKMESDVVQMCSVLFHGSNSTVGMMSSGGTESLLCMVQTYRDRARRQKPWILRPNMVLPLTAHPAFAKAGHYFNVQMRFARCDEDGHVNVKHMKSLVNTQTIAMAASAPHHASGVVDPIPELAGFAKSKKLPFHVDACFGGFIMPWLERLGVQFPKWDFRVEGVTSISADIHKYGYAPKGASVLLYCDMNYFQDQFFIFTEWPGGIYASPGMLGTRQGGAIAAAWASISALGEDGYMALAKQAWTLTKELEKQIQNIEELRLLGAQHSTIVTWASRDEKKYSTFAIADQLAQKGWDVCRQQNPSAIHLTVNANNAQVAEQYIDDLREAVAYVKAHPQSAQEGEAAMYGMMAKVPLRGMVKKAILDVMKKMYSPDGPQIELNADQDVPKWAVRALDLYDDLRQKFRS